MWRHNDVTNSAQDHFVRFMAALTSLKGYNPIGRLQFAKVLFDKEDLPLFVCFMIKVKHLTRRKNAAADPLSDERTQRQSTISCSIAKGCWATEGSKGEYSYRS